MAFSILSLGMFTARAFWMMRRSAGLVSGLGPPDFTAMARSLPTRVKALAILSQRLNIVALRVSKIRPMDLVLPGDGARGEGWEGVVDQRTQGRRWRPAVRPASVFRAPPSWVARLTRS